MINPIASVPIGYNPSDKLLYPFWHFSLLFLGECKCCTVFPEFQSLPVICLLLWEWGKHPAQKPKEWRGSFEEKLSCGSDSL